MVEWVTMRTVYQRKVDLGFLLYVKDEDNWLPDKSQVGYVMNAWEALASYLRRRDQL